MEFEYEIKCKYENDVVDFVMVFTRGESGIWTLRYTSRDISGISDGFDCHKAFNKMRIELGENYIFLCNCCRKNFLLSPMLSQTGGMRGYLVEMGKVADPDSIVETFSPIAAECSSSVREQSEFINQYFESFD